MKGRCPSYSPHIINVASGRRISELNRDTILSSLRRRPKISRRLNYAVNYTPIGRIKRMRYCFIRWGIRNHYYSLNFKNRRDHKYRDNDADNGEQPVHELFLVD